MIEQFFLGWCAGYRCSSPVLWVYAPPWGGYGLCRYSYVVLPYGESIYE